MKRGFARNTDLESVRRAELHSAESEAPDMDVRWPHRQHACVPITRAAQLTIDQHYRPLIAVSLLLAARPDRRAKSIQ